MSLGSLTIDTSAYKVSRSGMVGCDMRDPTVNAVTVMPGVLGISRDPAISLLEEARRGLTH